MSNLEPICSICGCDESSAFPFVEASELVTDGKMLPLLCKTCDDEAGKKPLVSCLASHEPREEEGGSRLTG